MSGCLFWPSIHALFRISTKHCYSKKLESHQDLLCCGRDAIQRQDAETSPIGYWCRRHAYWRRKGSPCHGCGCVCLSANCVRIGISTMLFCWNMAGNLLEFPCCVQHPIPQRPQETVLRDCFQRSVVSQRKQDIRFQLSCLRSSISIHDRTDSATTRRDRIWAKNSLETHCCADSIHQPKTDAPSANYAASWPPSRRIQGIRSLGP